MYGYVKCFNFMFSDNQLCVMTERHLYEKNDCVVLLVHRTRLLDAVLHV